MLNILAKKVSTETADPAHIHAKPTQCDDTNQSAAARHNIDFLGVNFRAKFRKVRQPGEDDVAEVFTGNQNVVVEFQFHVPTMSRCASRNSLTRVRASG